MSIDQSTSGTKAVLVDESGAVKRREQLPHRQYYPASGRAEHDAQEIYNNVLELIDRCWSTGVLALAITNQRETTVIWDRATGEPVCPAVVWQDVRGEEVCRELAHASNDVYERTGLKLSPYYMAAKLGCVFKENPAIHARALNGELCAGTIDSYLVYRFTGEFLTDVSNASRTQLMNLRALEWDGELLKLFGIPRSMMADRIQHSDAKFGTFRGVPVTGVLGDSHASLFGHGCHERGMVKTSYGTGSSIMQNVGGEPVFSRNGLSSSVGYGFRGEVCYVLEGNITCSADTLVWIKEELRLVQDIAEIEQLARTVESSDGVCLVPAFSGLGAPYFDSNARAIISGMNRGTTKAHVLRAALDSIAHQNADVLDAMMRDTGEPVVRLNADGGGSVNALLMQTQADLVPCDIYCSAEKDLTALGAAYMAGLATGFYQEFSKIGNGSRSPAAIYRPALDDTARNKMRSTWADAVRRAR